MIASHYLTWLKTEDNEFLVEKFVWANLENTGEDAVGSRYMARYLIEYRWLGEDILG
ncbi:hypothetical protein B0O99DRAFT_693811 [Bisporella sp. PMI_857]|nr:hypothetical protein B0O99DRAFT_693811 [Bisporella sp. PMI_857]